MVYLFEEVFWEKLMLYSDFTINNRTGWGAIGTYLLKEMSYLTDLKVVRRSKVELEDEFDMMLFKNLFIDDEQYLAIMNKQKDRLDAPLLSPPYYAFPQFVRPEPFIRGTKNFLYTVFEHNFLNNEDVNLLTSSYDYFITACKWAEDALRNAGITNVTTINHGIDPMVFNTFYAEKEYFKDKFVIFSGGKFEFRKGQDVIVRAYKHLQDKYDDVVLVGCWYNPWQSSFNTMKSTKFINFAPQSADYETAIREVLFSNGIDLNRVVLPKYAPNYMMARLYRNSDVGIFTNRCEAGTNLVLMEYMACGKPAIVTYSSGNRDVVDENAAILLKELRNCEIRYNDRVIANWDDPNLGEVIEKLEWAYHNRDSLKNIGQKAGELMHSKYTWKNIAGQFMDVISENS